MTVGLFEANMYFPNTALTVKKSALEVKQLLLASSFALF